MTDPEKDNASHDFGNEADIDKTKSQPTTEADQNSGSEDERWFDDAQSPPGGGVASDEEPVRFTLGELLALIAVASFVLAALPHVSPATFAFVLGVATFVGLVVISFANNLRSVFMVGWWIMLAIYLVAAVAAAMRT